MQQEIIETKKSLWRLRGKEKKQYPRKPEEVSELEKLENMDDQLKMIKNILEGYRKEETRKKVKTKR